MPTRSTPVRSALARAGALLGVAQAPRKLNVMVGHPIPYRVALPARARIEEDADLLVARAGELAVLVVARDMLARGQDPPPTPRAEPRRILTSMIMGSDALLFALLAEEFRSREMELQDMVRGTGMLGGERAVCVHGRFREHGPGGWMEMYGTVKDGVLYVLAFTAPGAQAQAHEALLARIRDSFVLPR
jgi:hypothetical protein